MEKWNENELLAIQELLSHITPTNYNTILDIIILHLELHRHNIDMSLNEVCRHEEGLDG